MMAYKLVLNILILALLIPNITEAKNMTETEFWKIIESAQGSGGDEAHAKRLISSLKLLNGQQILSFDEIYRTKLEAANTGSLWAAGTLLNEGHGTDDGFLYFRNWLIGQGESTYHAALSNPDSLINVNTDDEWSSAEWEYYGDASMLAYEDITKRDFYEDMNQSTKPIDSSNEFAWEDFGEPYMRKHLPKLWVAYGSNMVESEKEVEKLSQVKKQYNTKAEVKLPRLGVVKAGVILIHSTFGSGTILGVEPNLLGAVVTIQFTDKIKHIVLGDQTQHLFTRQD